MQHYEFILKVYIYSKIIFFQNKYTYWGKVSKYSIQYTVRLEMFFKLKKWVTEFFRI